MGDCTFRVLLDRVKSRKRRFPMRRDRTPWVIFIRNQGSRRELKDSMPSHLEGMTELTCRALLEHPRCDSHSHIAVIFDASLKGSGLGDGEPSLCCSFRYVKKEIGEYFETGIYDITVRVRSSPYSLYAVNASSARSQVFKREGINRVHPVLLQISL